MKFINRKLESCEIINSLSGEVSLQCLIHFPKTNRNIDKKNISELATGGVLDKIGILKVT